jgi:hypothetical protein
MEAMVMVMEVIVMEVMVMGVMATITGVKALYPVLSRSILP